ncbi:MAG: hypothetical protein JO352_34090 [Chloroflexi bacterium]|nr:hypothetical protein [Chloroflexota bacterium]
MLEYAALATRDRASVEAMATPWLQVHAVARERGLKLVTADRVAADNIDPRRVVLIATDWTRDAQKLVSQGARPGVLVSFDPPVIAWWLYYHLERVSALFPHTFMYEGARERVAPTTRFHPLFFPVPCPPPRPTGLPWTSRRFMVAIDDNAALPRPRDLGRWLDRPRELSIERMWAGLRYRPIGHERYQARLRAIEAFSTHDDFDLFGEGWDHRHPAVDLELHEAAARAFRGGVHNRLALLAKYRFALVYENTRFPGYVSDSILDCFFARCIPIYSGAPDVAQYVPPSAFIDVRQFQSFPELERFLVLTSEDDARRYVDAAHAFLISPRFESWCVDRFARDVVDALLHVATA